MIDYYKEIDEALCRYETYMPYTKTIDWIANRIDWCWKFKKITEDQMAELADRTTAILKEV